jgi:signal transduction histidine kinase
VGYCIADASGLVLEANRALASLLGATRSALAKQPLTRFIAQADQDTYYRMRQKLLANPVVAAATDEMVSCELRMVRSGSTQFWAHITATVVPGNVLQTGDKAIQLRLTLSDISASKQAEAEIEILARFPSENPSPVLRVNVESNLLYSNEAGTLFLPEWHLIVGEPVPQILQEAVTDSMLEQKTKIIETAQNDKVISFFVVPITKAGYANLYGRDVTEQKKAGENIRQLNLKLEERVRERTAQLENANKELETFSYSVSHDLRAPLRGIDGWSQALLEDYHDQLDEQGQQYIERVRSEAQRMGRLIDDMLQLSQMARAVMIKKRVDLSALAQTIVERLKMDEPQRQVDFKIQAGLSAKGDSHLLEVVLVNLLGNAFKFTSKQPEAHIEFGRTESKGQGVFFIRDNGAGFDMAYSKKLFGAFQRMHKNSEFPGTGIGLATVQRIIHRHDGRVWAEAEVGHGATFYFTIEEIT